VGLKPSGAHFCYLFQIPREQRPEIRKPRQTMWPEFQGTNKGLEANGVTTISVLDLWGVLFHISEVCFQCYQLGIQNILYM